MFLVVSEDGHASHGISELSGPLALVFYEALEFLSDSWVDSELGVGWENEDVLWRGGGLGVVLDVPNTWSDELLDWVLQILG